MRPVRAGRCRVTARTLLIVGWISQTFIQLVMLAVLQIGQNLQARGADARAQQTYDDAEAILHECLQLQQHLMTQDEVLLKQDEILVQLGSQPPHASGPGRP